MQLNIVYLDDEPLLCEMFVDNFSSPSIAITTFTDPDMAIQAVGASRPDLVFLDYRLPKTTGVEVAARLDPSIPKVLVSGDLALAESPAFVMAFQKPYDFDEMELFIQGYLDRKRA